jgi:hypothetical protein
MSKKITIAAKPQAANPGAVTTDQWVQSGNPTAKSQERKKRLTIDVPLSLHGRIKSQCALRGLKMKEEIVGLLEEHFPEGAKAAQSGKGTES